MKIPTSGCLRHLTRIDHPEPAEGKNRPGFRWRSGPAWVVLSVCVFSFALRPGSSGAFADESNAPPPAAGAQLEETNSQRTLQAILQLEGLLRSNQMAIEQSATKAGEVAARNAEMVSNGMRTIEQALSAQQEALAAHGSRELAALQSANRTTLIVGSTFAAIASLAALLIAWFQWRMGKAWTEIAAALPLARGPGGGSAVSAFGPEDPKLALNGPAAESNRRLLGGMDQLERRIQQLEQLSAPVLRPMSTGSRAGGNGGSSQASDPGPGDLDPEPADTNGHDRIAALLEQGKSLLRENDWEAAVGRFDEVLALNPSHGEALLKKGTALERLQKLNEAFECYERAIAVDDSMATAYLHKGGLYNRLERFKEALECYEKALQTHDERHG